MQNSMKFIFIDLLLSIFRRDLRYLVEMYRRSTLTFNLNDLGQGQGHQPKDIHKIKVYLSANEVCPMVTELTSLN